MYLASLVCYETVLCYFHLIKILLQINDILINIKQQKNVLDSKNCLLNIVKGVILKEKEKLDYCKKHYAVTYSSFYPNLMLYVIYFWGNSKYNLRKTIKMVKA